ncbi:MAG TPA: VWA domain-containing protein [Bryobacteraceae bacterium]|nr:VWA domain-containing protein [Bryobacteraceae bacterium]
MRTIPFALLLTLLAATTLLPQQKPQQAKNPQQAAQPSNQPYSFTMNVNTVMEAVSVKDKNGKPIEGLTAKDFVVTEDNVPQTITFCDYQKMQDEVLPSMEVPKAPPITADTAKSKVDSLTRMEILPEAPGDLKYRNRRLLAMYFDLSAMPPTDQFRAFDAADKFIAKEMKAADLMAIVKYDGEATRVLVDFTDKRDDLLMAINKMAIADEGLDDVNSDADAADTGSAFGEDDSEFNLFNTNRQLAALQTALKMLSSLNEKKVLIYFASGLQLSGIDNQAQFQATTNAAIRANTVIYSIDARGLVALAPMGNATQGSPGGAALANGGGMLAQTNRFQASQDTMYALATDTGGKALLDNNDLSTGVEQAEASVSDYYLIGYNTTNSKLDGKMRRIKISLKEDATAKLDYRQVYFANKTWEKFTSSDKDRQLQDALMMGDPMTEIDLSLQVNYFQLNSAEYFTGIAMKIPGSELALARKGGAERTTIDLVGEVKDEYGSTVGNIRDHVDQKISGETAQQLQHMPIEWDTNLVLLPGKYVIKVLARDDETGRIGTYIKNFTIPNLNKELTKVPMSSVVFGSQLINKADALYTSKNQDKGPSVNPMILDGIKLMPSINNVFNRNKDLYVFLQAYEKGAETQRPLVAYVTFYRGQNKAFETPPLSVKDGMDPKSKAVSMRFSVALNKLPPGKYDCQVTVVDPTGQKVNFWKDHVMLVN